MLEKSFGVSSFYRGKYQSGWDVFGSGFKVHHLEHNDKNMAFVKDFEKSMQSMVNKITSVMIDSEHLAVFIDAPILNLLS